MSGFGIALLVTMVEDRMHNGESREAAIRWVADYAELRSEAIEKLKNACQTPLEQHIGNLGVTLGSLRDYAVLDGERLQALWATLDACTRALELVRPFMAEDFPHGPDGAACVTEGYREAYKALLGALGPDQPDCNHAKS